jgi:hypothetical protein
VLEGAARGRGGGVDRTVGIGRGSVCVGGGGGGARAAMAYDAYGNKVGDAVPALEDGGVGGGGGLGGLGGGGGGGRGAAGFVRRNKRCAVAGLVCGLLVLALGLTAFFMYPRSPAVSLGPDAFKGTVFTFQNCAVGAPGTCQLIVTGTIGVTVQNPNYATLEVSKLQLKVIYSDGPGNDLVVNVDREEVSTLPSGGTAVVDIKVSATFVSDFLIGLSMASLASSCNNNRQAPADMVGSIQVKHPLFSGPISLDSKAIMIAC